VRRLFHRRQRQHAAKADGLPGAGRHVLAGGRESPVRHAGGNGYRDRHDKGGNGNPITPVLSGTTNFALQGANLVVARAGIAAADCSGKSEMVHVTAMQ
jgi:hypothetical protein